MLKTADTMDKIGEYKLADKLTQTAQSGLFGGLSSNWPEPKGLWSKSGDGFKSVQERVDHEIIKRAQDLSANSPNIMQMESTNPTMEEEMYANLRSLREPLETIFSNDINADVSNLDGDTIKKMAAELTNPDANKLYTNLEPTNSESIV